MKGLSVTVFLTIALAFSAIAQNVTVTGVLVAEGEELPFATVILKQDSSVWGTTSDASGKFEVQVAPGKYLLEISNLGYLTFTRDIVVSPGSNEPLNIGLDRDWYDLDQMVVTGTRTSKKITDSPVMVDVISSKTLNNTQSCNLSEGLKFQPGLRVETDCQTCNYTQLRMNGLGGGYSQILINGRPIFSPLTGLYGMEQIPTNMIDRIEVVRGGGSSLYGSSAIGGIVNVITSTPTNNGYQASYTYQNISGAAENVVAGNATIVSKNNNSGITFFVNHRDREFYDHNGDNYSELPKLNNNSMGTNMFFKPGKNQKVEINSAYLHEYRIGGDMINRPAHLSEQAEERTHNVVIANIDYQVNFNDNRSSFIAYAAGQHSDRKHFTGVKPDTPEEVAGYISDPPYGNSDNGTFQGGAQVNHRITNFLGGSNVITVGSEFIADDVVDVIPAYGYKIDQKTENLAFFGQTDWTINNSISLLAGLRLDDHNMVDRPIVSPRASMMYKFRKYTQFRVNWATGFRAPQAFDSDMHVAFAGGGVSRIALAQDLREERSNSLSASANFDKALEKVVYGFTMEGFYTRLNNAFFLQPLGQDEFGERFEKQNGEGATVQGVTLEARANFNRKAQIEAGYTLQSSLYDQPVENIEGLPPAQQFLRTPDQYGYAILSTYLPKNFTTTVNVIYTGSMLMAHFGGAPEQLQDSYEQSDPFVELSTKISYTLEIKGLGSGIEFFTGVKNIMNAYQNDFDTGKNRDSNYIYGPGLPRTWFFGIKLSSILN